MSEPTPSATPALPPKPKKNLLWLWITLGVVAVAAIVAAIIFLPKAFSNNDASPSASPNSSSSASPSSEPTVVKLGTTDASQGHWAVLQELLAEENIVLELVSFDAYELPNPALQDKQIDLNAFQHIDYLSNHNVATGDALAVVGPTLLVPLPIYSTKYEDIAEFPEGSQIAIPNDPSNQARALRVLEAAELIVLPEGVDVPTPADVVTADSKVVPVAVEPNLTAASLNDPQIAAAIINNNFALDAGIDPDSALFWVDPSEQSSWPYINIIASRAGEENNPIFQKVLELYHDPRVSSIVVEESGNSAIIVTETPERVRGWLAEIEAAKQN